MHYIVKAEWADKFVNKYRNLLHSDFRDSSYNYCMANIYLEKGKYDAALEMLSKVEPLDVIFKLYINKTLLMIYFCKNEAESFFSLVDSFRHFLKRNKELRSDDRTSHNNFVYFIRQLFILKSNSGKKDNSDFLFLRDRLENNNQTVLKKWLLGKIKEAELS